MSNSIHSTLHDRIVYISCFRIHVVRVTFRQLITFTLTRTIIFYRWWLSQTRNVFVLRHVTSTWVNCMGWDGQSSWGVFGKVCYVDINRCRLTSRMDNLQHRTICICSVYVVIYSGDNIIIVIIIIIDRIVHFTPITPNVVASLILQIITEAILVKTITTCICVMCVVWG